MSRWRSFLPDLMTVRAVMVRAALEKKINSCVVSLHAVSDVGALVEWLQEHIVFGQNSADNLAVLHNQGARVWIECMGYSIWTAGYLT